MSPPEDGPADETADERRERLRAERMWKHRRPCENRLVQNPRGMLFESERGVVSTGDTLDPALGLLTPHGVDASAALGIGVVLRGESSEPTRY